MTEGGVGVWEKMTDDNDRGGQQQETIKKIEPGPNFLMFWVCGGEELAKIVDHTKGAQK